MINFWNCLNNVKKQQKSSITVFSVNTTCNYGGRNKNQRWRRPLLIETLVEKAMNVNGFSRVCFTFNKSDGRISSVKHILEVKLVNDTLFKYNIYTSASYLNRNGSKRIRIKDVSQLKKRTLCLSLFRP